MNGKRKPDLGMILALGFALLLAGLELEAQRCTTELTVARYEVPADLTEPIRIVHLTDLHGRRFGAHNEALSALVAEQQPDLILMTGDMLDRSDPDAQPVCDLIRACATVAPVYYGYGNHEEAWIERTGGNLGTMLTQAGAVVLDTEYRDVGVNDQMLRIGGYDNYYRQPHMYPLSEKEKQRELAFTDAFEDTGRWKILLCHIPTPWLDWGYLDRYEVDLVLCGHYHGGQIRLPGIGGLYAPYVGLFPEFTGGMYVGDRATVVLSTGLGSGSGIPRINNLPQVVVIDLIPNNQ